MSPPRPLRPSEPRPRVPSACGVGIKAPRAFVPLSFLSCPPGEGSLWSHRDARKREGEAKFRTKFPLWGGGSKGGLGVGWQLWLILLLAALNPHSLQCPEQESLELKSPTKSLFSGCSCLGLGCPEPSGAGAALGLVLAGGLGWDEASGAGMSPPDWDQPPGAPAHSGGPLGEHFPPTQNFPAFLLLLLLLSAATPVGPSRVTVPLVL